MCMCCAFDIIDPRSFRGKEPPQNVTGPNHVLTLKEKKKKKKKNNFKEAK